MKKAVKELLSAVGFSCAPKDEPLLDRAAGVVKGYARSSLNIKEIPEEYTEPAARLAAAFFLMTKKTFSPADITGLNFETAVKRIEAGDTNIEFYSDATLTDEQRLDRFVKLLEDSGKAELKALRRLRW